MLSLQLLVAFSVCISAQQAAKDCDRNLILDFYCDLNDTIRQCTQIYGVQIDVNHNKCPNMNHNQTNDTTTSDETLKSLNLVEVIDSSTMTSRHFVSLDIRNTYLEYQPGTFLPNLKKIIPTQNSTSSVIYIRGNKNLCLPEKVKTKLLNMVDGRGYIQPCSCRTSFDLSRTVTTGIYGEENCRVLYGGLIFNGDTVMTEKMRRQLENVEELYGFIQFENTNFTSLDFLKNLKKVFYPASYKGNRQHDEIVRITGNQKLTSLGFTLDIVRDEVIGAGDRVNHVINIEENPKLRLKPIERDYYNSFIMTEMDFTSEEDPVWLRINFCILKEPVSENIESIKDCEKIRGNLTIDSSFDGYSLEEMDEIFGNLKFLVGCLTIRGTQLTSLTFLHELQAIYCKAGRSALIIEDNPELRYLDVQVDDFLSSPNRLTIKISNNPKLCFTEAYYLKNLINDPWRVIKFDRWNEICWDVRANSARWLPYYYAMGAGILVVGIIVVEGVALLVQRKLDKRAEEEQVQQIE